MNKVIPFMLLVFFIAGSFVTTLNAVLAEGLVEDSWNTKASLNQARTVMRLVVAEGKIYAIGGCIAWELQQSSVVGTNEQYDPMTDTWIMLEPMPTPRYGFAIVAWQGKIYCIGGSSFDDKQGRRIGFGVNEVYDIAADRWSTAKEAPFEGSAAAQVVNGKIFVVHEGDLYMYDPLTDVWTPKAHTPMEGDSLAVADGKLIVIFEFYADYPEEVLSISPLTKFVMIYDPETDMWSERRGKDTFFGTTFFVVGAPVGLYAPQKIYVMTCSKTSVYDLKSDTWSAAKAMPEGRVDGFAAVVFDDTLYVIGGNGPSVPPSDRYVALSTTEQYVPLGYSGFVSVTSEPSGGVSADPKPFLDDITVVAICLTIGITTIVGLSLYLKKRKRQKLMPSGVKEIFEPNLVTRIRVYAKTVRS
ncbi:MAG: hypothetical protein LBI79_00890 [Nitrososphaerota archaeon]|jgi:N-acetylneuraminic acid mutarotase|nr:hypothetical protein [Nitrososphaerota archaeon]